MTSQKICVGFGKTQIDPWDIFRRELIALIDTDSVICREIFNLSRSKFEKIEHVEDGEGFFNGLEKFFENRREEVVKYLHKLTKKQNLHVNEGSTSVASLLMNYAKHCREHEQRLKQIQICPTSPLIGRKREIAHALDCLQSSQCKGVWISGLDGMGKTSLAFEICRRLFIENWRIFKVELREQLYVGDLVRSALEVIGGPFLLPPTAGLSDEVLESSTEDDDFVAYDNYCTKSLFIQNFWEHGQNKVYVLDGVDEILTHDETEFYLFLGMLLERIREAENKLNSEGKSRILITTQTQVRKSPVIRKNFIEIELKGLSINDAKEFLREKSKPVNVQVNEKDMEAIASDCGFSPLAMVLVLNNQRDSNKPDEPIVVPNENMSVNARNSVSCVNVYLEKSVLWLENPDKNYPLITLMRLAVFRTLNFTIDAACFICGKEDSGKANMLNVIMSLRNRYLLETTVERFKENEDSKEGYEQPSFYIHTLVYNILRKKEESYMSYVQDSRKRFVEYMDKKLSKVTEKSLIELLKIDENFKSHVQLFIKYLTEMPFLRPSLEDGPGIVGRINREWIAEWIVDSHAKCKYYKEIIAESKRDSNASETVYYLMCLAKLYFDHYKFDQCRVALSESLDIVENDHKLSKEANYIKRKKKSKNCFHSIVLSKVWTMQARVLNVEGKYDKGEEYVKFALVATEKKTEECWHDRANIHNLLGIILFKLERYKEAEMNHKYAHDILTSHEGFWNEEVYLTNIGTALFKQVDKELPENHILEHAGQYYSSALNVKTSTPHNKARTLSFRGKLYLKIGKLEESHKDLQASLDIWKATVQSPNINLISAYHNLSTLLLRKCTKLFQMDKIIEASRVLASAYNNYQEIQSQIAKGGFNNWQRNLTMYDQIKKNHRRVLRQVNKEEKEIDLVNNFYSDFESGIFNRTGPQNEFLEREEEFSPLSEERIASSNYDVTSDSSSAVCITSDEDRKLSEQTFKDISGTGSPNNSYQDENYRGNNQFRNQVDSGLGDSITSLSSLSESGNYWSTSSGSIEEEVFPNEDETRDDSWKKRKSLDKSKTQTLKRQKNLDVDEMRWTTLF